MTSAPRPDAIQAATTGAKSPVTDAFDSLRDPRCAESQADGVPCMTLDVACAECGRSRRPAAPDPENPPVH
jgi:hypothetical protein